MGVASLLLTVRESGVILNLTDNAIPCHTHMPDFELMVDLWVAVFTPPKTPEADLSSHAHRVQSQPFSPLGPWPMAPCASGAHPPFVRKELSW